MVVSGASIDFVAPAQIGDHITAVATESLRTPRHGIYDVVVINEPGATIAHFRGRCSRLRAASNATRHQG
jgi:acyl-CoA thioesterase